MNLDMASEALGVKFLIVSNSVLALLCIGLVTWIVLKSAKRIGNKSRAANSSELNNVLNVDLFNKIDRTLSEFNSKVSSNDFDWKKDDTHTHLLGGLYKILNGIVGYLHSGDGGGNPVIQNANDKSDDSVVGKGLSQVLKMIESLHVLIETGLKKAQEDKLTLELELMQLRAAETQLRQSLVEAKTNSAAIKSKLELAEAEISNRQANSMQEGESVFDKIKLETELEKVYIELEAEKKLSAQYKTDFELLESNLKNELSGLKSQYEEIQQTYVRVMAEKAFIENAYMKEI